MHTHPPIDPDDPGGTSGEDLREPPLPATQGMPREEIPRKGDLVDPDPASTDKYIRILGRPPVGTWSQRPRHSR
jgi:hypothetical protein